MMMPPIKLRDITDSAAKTRNITAWCDWVAHDATLYDTYLKIMTPIGVIMLLPNKN